MATAAPDANSKMLRMRADKLLMGSTAPQGPLEWAVGLLHELGISVQPPEETDAFDLDEVEMYEVIEKEAIGMKYDNIDAGNIDEQLQWGGAGQLAPSGFAVAFSQPGCSVHLPTHMQRLPQRDEKTGKLAKHASRAHVPSKYELGARFAVRFTFCEPGSTGKQVQRGCYMELRGLMIVLALEGSNELTHGLQYGCAGATRLERVTVQGLFASRLALHTEVLFDCSIQGAEELRMKVMPVSVPEVDAYIAWLEEKKKTDANATNLVRVLTNMYLNLQYSPVVSDPVAGEVDAVGTVLSSIEHHMTQTYPDVTALLTERNKDNTQLFTTISSAHASKLWASSCQGLSSHNGFVRPQNWFAEETMDTKFDWQSFTEKDNRPIVIAGEDDDDNNKKKKDDQRPKSEKFLDDLGTFPTTFDAARSAFSGATGTKLWAKLTALEGAAKAEAAAKLANKMMSLAGNDGRLTNLSNHPSNKCKLPGWCGEVINFCKSSLGTREKVKKKLEAFEEHLKKAYDAPNNKRPAAEIEVADEGDEEEEEDDEDDNIPLASRLATISCRPKAQTPTQKAKAQKIPAAQALVDSASESLRASVNEFKAMMEATLQKQKDSPSPQVPSEDLKKELSMKSDQAADFKRQVEVAGKVAKDLKDEITALKQDKYDLTEVKKTLSSKLAAAEKKWEDAEERKDWVMTQLCELAVALHDEGQWPKHFRRFQRAVTRLQTKVEQAGEDGRVRLVWTNKAPGDLAESFIKELRNATGEQA